MRRTIVQIGQIILILLVILAIPLIIESNSLRKGVKSSPEITTESVSDGKVLGESTSKFTISKSVDFQYTAVQKAGFYTILTLFVLSALSFTKYKISKKKV